MALELPEVVMAAHHGFSSLRPEIRSGDLVRLRRGAYLPASAAGEPLWRERKRSLLGRCVAVAERLTTPFAITGIAAAVLYGWAVVLRGERIDVMQTVNPGTGGTSDVVRHVVPSLASLGVRSVHGLPVVAPEEVALWCARMLRPDDALVVADAALADLAAMSRFDRLPSEERQASVRRDLLARLGAAGPARGVRQARPVLTLADGFAELPGESRLRWVALAAGMPPPICQYEVWVDGKQYFIDAAWLVDGSSRRLARPVFAEFDGAVKYRGQEGAAVVVAEKAREDAIRRSHAAEFVRFDSADLARPASAVPRLQMRFPSGALPRLRPRPELQLPRGR